MNVTPISRMEDKIAFRAMRGGQFQAKFQAYAQKLIRAMQEQAQDLEEKERMIVDGVASINLFEHTVELLKCVEGHERALEERQKQLQEMVDSQGQELVAKRAHLAHIQQTLVSLRKAIEYKEQHKEDYLYQQGEDRIKHVFGYPR